MGNAAVCRKGKIHKSPDPWSKPKQIVVEEAKLRTKCTPSGQFRQELVGILGL
jgi:hypothetical protein